MDGDDIKFLAAPKGNWGDGDIQSYKGEDVLDYPCVYLDTNGLYDFKDLRDISHDYTASSDFTDPQVRTVTFNFCKLITGCGSDNTFASMEINSECYELTTGDQHAADTDTISSPTGADGVRISRQGNQVCPDDDTTNLGFVIDVFCNENVTGHPPTKLVAFDSEYDDIGDPCIVHVQMEHSAGCAVVNYTWARRAIGALMMSVGFLLTYLRLKSMKWFMAVIV